MRKELTKAITQPVIFFDDWAQPPKGSIEDEYEQPGLTDLKKWRLQTLLAVCPWGIPSLALAEAFKKMFGKELDVQDLGFDHLESMISGLTDVFTVQEPDETTAIMFPDHPLDRILHDARLGHEFERHNSEGGHDIKSSDFDTLISLAWLNRDDDFPADVVLPGEEYNDIILPMTTAKIPKTRGVYQVVLTGAANPNRFYINIKGPDYERVTGLSSEIAQYFSECDHRIELYSVPDEFIYQGFPCLVYISELGTWERCSVSRRTQKGNKVLVETVDYGGLRTVSPIHLYLMPRRFFLIPTQSVLVSLVGLKPADGSGNWTGKVGTRLRCFSNPDYWMECVLLDREQTSEPTEKETPSPPSSSHGSDATDSAKSLRKKQRKKLHKEPKFDVIVCDRNDEEMDIYLDETLVLETYAVIEDRKSVDIKTYRDQLKDVMTTIPRAKNPLE